MATNPSSIRSLKMSFIMVWNVAGLLVSPKYMTRGLKSPQFVWKAAFHSSPSFIVSPSYVQFCKVLGLCAGDPIYNIRDEGKWIGVLHHHHVELPVVLNEPEFSILFINKKDWGCYRGLGGADPTSP